MVKRVTIVDIAKEANVSVSAVSKALMDAPDISKKTKELIKSTAEQLGYVPNISAASLKNGNSKMIAVLCDSLLNPYYYEMIYYLEIELSKKNYIVAVYRSNEFDLKMFNNILSRNFEGVISFISPNAEVETELKKHSFPAVILGRKAQNASYVCVDDYKVGNLAGDFFVKRGFKKTLYVGEIENLDITQIRFEGYKDALSKNNLVAKGYFKTKDHSITELLEEAYSSNSDLIDCEGIFCFSDVIAYEVMRFLNKIGRQDVVIVGVDNIHSEMPLPFHIYSIGVNKEKIIDRAIKILLDNINGINTKLIRLTEEVSLTEWFNF